MLLKTYPIAETFASGLNATQLDEALQITEHIVDYEGLTVEGDTLSVFGSSMSETELDTLVSSHVPNPVLTWVQKTVYESKVFSDDLMQRMKQKNILEGLDSIDQAAWIHHRLRKTDFTLSDETTVVQIDVMNLVISGDMETAEFVLGQMVPDDMTEAYHWLNQERIDWIRNEIRTYLGWPLL